MHDDRHPASQPSGRRAVAVRWTWNRLADIAPADLLDLLALRSAVFVVEQRCAFLDIDEADRDAWHLHGRDDDGRLVATLRLLAPGVRFAEPSLGRICVSLERRGSGLGRELTLEGIAAGARHYPGWPLRISAQQRLEAFYRSLGFDTVSAPYDEDGIPHVQMLRR